MKKLDKSNYPHGDLIRDNETITLRSIFDFTKGADELFLFLYGCQKHNCTVVFKNEGISVSPNSEPAQHMILSLYALTAVSPKAANDYMRYLTLLSNLNENQERLPQAIQF